MKEWSWKKHWHFHCCKSLWEPCVNGQCVSWVSMFLWTLWVGLRHLLRTVLSASSEYYHIRAEIIVWPAWKIVWYFLPKNNLLPLGKITYISGETGGKQRSSGQHTFPSVVRGFYDRLKGESYLLKVILECVFNTFCSILAIVKDAQIWKQQEFDVSVLF